MIPSTALLLASTLFSISVQATVNGTAGNQTFDYVVVGGGTGGIPIGVRLAQAGYNVAIVEAGSYYELTDPLITATPAGDFLFAGASIIDNQPLIDWSFVTQPNPGQNGRTYHYARGKCLGGTSSRNAMIYQRGTTGSYQQWADEVNDQSYALESFQKYFKNSATFTPPNAKTRAANATPEYNAGAFSTPGGPLTVTYPNYAQPFSSYFQAGMNAIGIDNATDFNSGSLIGAAYYQTTIIPETQKRGSSQTTYLAAFKDLPNLTVFTDTIGKKIMFDAKKKATGVQVESLLSLGIPYTLTIKKEVILSAGAFQSPQLLMVSGVGPAATLKQYDIPVVYDNPNVGSNMHDHVWFGPSYKVNVETLTRLANNPAYVLAQFLGPYSTSHTGPLTTNAGDFAAFEKVPQRLRSQFTPQALAELAQFPADWPEVEYVAAAAYFGNFSDPLADQPKDGHQYASIVSALVAPLSRGNISIASADMNNPPLIYPNLLTSTTDQQVAIAAFKRSREAFESRAMAPVLIGKEYFPGAAVQSDDEILEYIRSNSMTYYHSGSTCAMGDASAKNSKAVVDNHAKVIGVRGVRVVDAAALPFLPPSHIQSTIYALAEKIADDIKNGN